MRKDSTPWTDETLMPWGEHEGTRLADIPASYLAWFMDQDWARDWPQLHNYCQLNETRIEAEIKENRPDEDEDGEFTTYQDFLNQR